jgi:hypothetical protein
MCIDGPSASGDLARKGLPTKVRRPFAVTDAAFVENRYLLRQISGKAITQTGSCWMRSPFR